MSETNVDTKQAAQGLMNTKELARYLRITTRTVANLLSRRKIPVLRIGSVNRYQVHRVLAALEEHSIGGSPRLGNDNKN